MRTQINTVQNSSSAENPLLKLNKFTHLVTILTERCKLHNCFRPLPPLDFSRSGWLAAFPFLFLRVCVCVCGYPALFIVEVLKGLLIQRSIFLADQLPTLRLHYQFEEGSPYDSCIWLTKLWMYVIKCWKTPNIRCCLVLKAESTN
jgi:hypothetical protein